MTNGSGNKPPQGNQPTQQGAPSPWYQQAPAGAPVSPFPQPGQAQPPMQQPGQPPMQQPGQVPLQPSTLPAQPDAGGDPAFGFDAQQQPKDEKYDTLYLAANMQKERRRTQYIVIGIILFAIIGAIFWVSMMPESEPPGAREPGKAATAPAKAPAPAANEEPGGEQKADDAE